MCGGKVGCGDRGAGLEYPSVAIAQLDLFDLRARPLASGSSAAGMATACAGESRKLSTVARDLA